MARKVLKEERNELFLKWTKTYSRFLARRGGLIVGLDPARGKPGLAIYRPKKDSFKVYSVATQSKGFSKVIEVKKWIDSIIGGKKIMMVMIEDYSYNSKFGREGAGELGGVIRAYLWERGIPCIPVSALTLKKTIGASDKSHIMKEVYKKFEIDVKDDNQADAFVLALIGKMLYNAVNELSKKMNQENISKIESKPHNFCSLNVKDAGTVKDILVNKGKTAYEFSKGKEELKKTKEK